MSRLALACGAFFGLSALIVAAITGHGWRAELEPVRANAFASSLDYHQLHALVLLLIGVLLDRRPACLLLKLSAGLLIVGTVVFCTSLYLLVLGAPMMILKILGSNNCHCYNLGIREMC